MADNTENRDVNELSPEEAAALAYERSNVSKEDFDPTADGWDHADSVVELPDRGSVFVKDLVDHPDPVIATDAQAVVDGNFPGGPNYPNGPGDSPQSEPRKSAPAPQKSTDTPRDQNAS